MTRYITLFLILLMSQSIGYGQSWRQLLNQGETDFNKIKKAFYDEWGDRPAVRGSGYKQFKRWEEFMSDRLDEKGKITNIADNYFLRKKLDAIGSIAPRVESSVHYWHSVGPYSWLNDTDGYNPGHGRINCITVVGDEDETVYVGAPIGGIWKSTNLTGGWELLTEELTNVGITDIYVDPENPERILILTGDAYGNISQSTGVMMSADGGQSWERTGLQHGQQSYIYHYKMEVIPSDKNIILVAGTEGILRSSDGGNTWTEAMSGGTITDLIIHPVADSIIYAAGVDELSGLRYLRSVDYGVTWKSLRDAVPASEQLGRVALGVSPDQPDLLYLLAADADGGFEGFYGSADKGLTFGKLSDEPNILSHDQNNPGGQGLYDLALAVNPNDAEDVYVGGFYIYRSGNGGRSFDRITNWLYDENDEQYVHADIHTLDFYNASLFTGCDGGIFRSDSVDEASKEESRLLPWTDIGDGLDITMFYRIGVDPADSSVIIGGTQDNGSNIRRNGDWYHIFGADGMEAIIDHTDSDIVYASIQFGDIYRFSLKGSQLQKRISGAGITERGDWITPYAMHPENHQVLYAGYRDVYRTSNQGDTWEKVSDLNRIALISDLKIAPSNPDYIYITNGDELIVTKDGGNTWRVRTKGLPERIINSIAISKHDESRVWVTMAGLDHDEKVFYSPDAGLTWENLSEGLPSELHVNSIIAQKNSEEQLYLGTDVGVFERSYFEDSWTFFSEGLPGIIVRELEIHEPSGTLLAATFGRGVWQTAIIPGAESTVEINGLLSDLRDVPEGGWISYKADLEGEVISYMWEFEGGIPTISNAAEPEIFYPNEGVFDIKLTVSGLQDKKTFEAQDYVSVSKVLNVIDESGTIEIFPNPAADVITIRIDEPVNKVDFRLIDMKGKTVLHSEDMQIKGEVDIALGELVRGLYLVSIESGDMRITEKLLIR